MGERSGSKNKKKNAKIFMGLNQNLWEIKSLFSKFLSLVYKKCKKKNERERGWGGGG